MKPTIDLVLKIHEMMPGVWCVRTEGVPGGDHEVGPFLTEADARSMQATLAETLAAKLGITPRMGNPGRH